MDPILLQKQLRDNSADLQDYFKDIQCWGEEMKRKEAALNSVEKSDVPLPRNKLSKIEKKSQRIDVQSPPSATTSKVPKDFAYWEKFDVDAECDKVDKPKSDDDSDLTDEFDETAIEMAQAEKEKGNKFVKSGRWKDAVQCYTQAIEYYSYDPTFYANRALCHLKLDQFTSADTDCTIALQFDASYVKALHRRAMAKEALKQYEEAKQDLKQALVIEPENKESQKLLGKIERINMMGKTVSKVEPIAQRPVSKFTAARQKKSCNTSKEGKSEDEIAGPAIMEAVVERRKPPSALPASQLKTVQQEKNVVASQLSTASICWPSGPDSEVDIVECINKPPRSRSTAPLRRILVQEATLRGPVK